MPRWPKKKTSKKKAGKKTTVKRKYTKSKKVTDDASLSAQESESELVFVTNRMLDVVEANTLQAKAVLTVLSQMQQLLVIALSAGENQIKTNSKVKVEDANNLSDSTSETKHTTIKIKKEPVIIPKSLSDGFLTMIKIIGEDKAHEYLYLYDKCKNINDLEERNFLQFKEQAHPFIKEVLAKIEKEKAEQESTGVTAPDEIKLKAEDVRNALKKVDKVKGRDTAKAILVSFDVQTVGKLPEEKYAEIIAKCEKEISE